jgi:plasmid stabilization system protein ParE
MRVVQALHWLQDVLATEAERDRIATILRRLFSDPKHGQSIRDDLRKGISALPIWMQEFLRPLLFDRREAAS